MKLNMKIYRAVMFQMIQIIQMIYKIHKSSVLKCIALRKKLKNNKNQKILHQLNL